MPLPSFPCALLALLALASSAPAAPAAAPAPTLPGPRQDGSTLLHNQWSLRPVGEQVQTGDFPTALAVHPSGKFAAVLCAGFGPHEVQLIDLATRKITATQPLKLSFSGLAFSPDGSTLLCGGGGDATLLPFSFANGLLTPQPLISLGKPGTGGAITGVAFSPDGRRALYTRMLPDEVGCVDLKKGKVLWKTALPPAKPAADGPLAGGHPFGIVWDAARGQLYVSLWGEDAVAVLDPATGKLLGRWQTGLHPNELALSADGRLFVSNGGLNTVSVVATGTGLVEETLRTSTDPLDPPGSTPDSLALSPDGKTLYAANAYNNNLAVFDISVRGSSRPAGFIPTGWFPSSVRMTGDGRTLLVASARGLSPKANPGESPEKHPTIHTLFPGSVGLIDLPADAAVRERALAVWTAQALRCRPTPPAAPAAPGPIPSSVGGTLSPLRHVVYIIKENRTYDQILGDMPEGNGDPRLCLFPEEVTPNHHALARDFVLLDNFYANAEVSAAGHEWSMGAYAAEIVEKVWPPTYGHRDFKLPYPAEGALEAAIPSSGYLWDQAAKAGVSYRSYGEFAVMGSKPGEPARSKLPLLKDHLDPQYRAWDLSYRDVDRAARFISELARFEREGEMPRLQILRLPQDHTWGARVGAGTPRAMVADNDLALGRIVEALSRSRFWASSAVFVVEDDAQDGPDHVDAHRTIAFVASPYARRGVVDSTAYTTCSMLRTIELILGLQPMSQFDALATPMYSCFHDKADLSPYVARPARVDLEERNTRRNAASRISAKLDFSREDAADMHLLNLAVWQAVRGEDNPMPAPVRAAFVRPLRRDDDED
jgi:DNA-binding beta-propeller fold protein YncE